MAGLKYWKLPGIGWKAGLKRIASYGFSTRNQSTGNIKWLWEADDTIQDYHRADLQGTRRGAMNLTVKSVKPLDADIVYQALEHLQKKTPALRTCIMHRGDSIWFCQPSDLLIDFRVEKSSNLEELLERTLTEKFRIPHFGQWRIIFVPEESKNKVFVSEVGEDYPYQCNIIFTGHHGLQDGKDNMVITKCFHQLLNDIMAGRPISDEEYAPFFSSEEMLQTIEDMKERLRNDKDYFEAVKNSTPPADRKPLLLQAYSRPKVSAPATKHIARILDAHVIRDFQTKSREVGVTFNSSLVVVMNIAVMELLQERGLIRDSYDIACHMYTDLRRFVKPSDKHIYGLYTSPMSYLTTVHKDIKENFWQCCQETHNEIQQLINRGGPLEHRALRELIEYDQPPFDYAKKVRPAIHDYTMTNVGDLSSFFFTGEGDHVKITNMQGGCKIHNSFNSTLNEIYTFASKCYYTLDYATDYFEDVTANKFMDKVFNLLRYFCR